MRYLPHTKKDVEEMLKKVGASSLEELFESVPESLRMKGDLDLPEPFDEGRLMDHMGALSVKNRALSCHASFVGCGAYRHHVPATVDMLISRGEFFTAYTPYQPEVSQGTLQGAFEFQTSVAEIMGMDVANASLYDGASACAEAVLMMHRVQRRRQRVLVSQGVHPEHLETCRTFTEGVDDLVLEEVPLDKDGATDLGALEEKLGKDVAGVLVQSPNVFGVVEKVREVAEKADEVRALMCLSVGELTSLGILESPGACGCHIAVGEGLGLCGPVNMGGPGVGLMACGDRYKRALPGRLVGETVDQEGRRGYVLTLATREQHIRREKATSNICTNQALMALSLGIHLSLLGKTGFRKLSKMNYSYGRYLRDKLKPSGLLVYPDSPHYNEFVVRSPGGEAAKMAQEIRHHEGIDPGVSLGRFKEEWKDLLLICVTERNTKAQMDALVEVLTKRARG